MIKLNRKFKKILVTGGTGSFGNEIVKSFLKEKNISEIRIFSRDELKQDDMRKSFKNLSKKIKKKFRTKFIIEIGSNDGAFIKNFNKKNAVGVEPCKNLAKITMKKGKLITH